MCKFWNCQSSLGFVSLLFKSLVVRVGVSYNQTASHWTWVSAAANIPARWLAEGLEASRQRYLLILNHSGKSVQTPTATRQTRSQCSHRARAVCLSDEESLYEVSSRPLSASPGAGGTCKAKEQIQAIFIMSSLDNSLFDEVPLEIKPLAVDHLWGQQPSHFVFHEDKPNLDAYFDSYFKYYAQQCDLIGRHENGEYSSVETHIDIMTIAHLLQQPLTRAEVRKHMTDVLKSTNITQHDNSINLVARLMLMIRIGGVPHEYSKGEYLEWKEGDLREFVHIHFAAPSARARDRIKLEKSFNALNVQRIGGIKIWWTDNLADHLRMMDDDKAVFIFHHGSFLEHQLHNPMFPPCFIEETLRTLMLLFPRYNPGIKKWYQKEVAKSACGLDKRLIGVGNLNAEERQSENFNYWHDRLVILKEVYDEARPNTLSQFWYDRRNGPQWYTFWVALWVLVLTIVTIVLAVVQCVEGGLQVYLAMRA